MSMSKALHKCNDISFMFYVTAGRYRFLGAFHVFSILLDQIVIYLGKKYGSIVLSFLEF